MKKKRNKFSVWDPIKKNIETKKITPALSFFQRIFFSSHGKSLDHKMGIQKGLSMLYNGEEITWEGRTKELWKEHQRRHALANGQLRSATVCSPWQRQNNSLIDFIHCEPGQVVVN